MIEDVQMRGCADVQMLFKMCKCEDMQMCK